MSSQLSTKSTWVIKLDTPISPICGQKCLRNRLAKKTCSSRDSSNMTLKNNKLSKILSLEQPKLLEKYFSNPEIQWRVRLKRKMMVIVCLMFMTGRQEHLNLSCGMLLSIARNQFSEHRL